MDDFDKCVSIECDLKYKCKRFMQRDVNKYQWVTHFYNKDKECEEFIENKI
jgi:hypothetical protein